MTRSPGHVQTCSLEDARVRLAQARKFLEVAELVSLEEQLPESATAAAAVAVLAGIAAADAACCAALGRRSRSQSHRDAADLLCQVEPGGGSAAATLRRLLDLKDTAHYGLIAVSGQRLKRALRQAADLVEFAGAILRR